MHEPGSSQSPDVFYDWEWGTASWKANGTSFWKAISVGVKVPIRRVFENLEIMKSLWEPSEISLSVAVCATFFALRYFHSIKASKRNPEFCKDNPPIAKRTNESAHNETVPGKWLLALWTASSGVFIHQGTTSQRPESQEWLCSIFGVLHRFEWCHSDYPRINLVCFSLAAKLTTSWTPLGELQSHCPQQLSSHPWCSTARVWGPHCTVGVCVCRRAERAHCSSNPFLCCQQGREARWKIKVPHGISLTPASAHFWMLFCLALLKAQSNIIIPTLE